MEGTKDMFYVFICRNGKNIHLFPSTSTFCTHLYWYITYETNRTYDSLSELYKIQKS